MSASPTKTLQEYISHEEELVRQASEAMPHRFDQCTHTLGHIRQGISWCLTCKDTRGICSACSVSCHGDHEQVELFPKRSFRCDCPTSSLAVSCKLHKTLEEPNTTNVYGQNFQGKFCRCGREYNPETEAETMVQCVACEDWYHESCLHMRARKPSHTPSSAPPAFLQNNVDDNDDDDQDDESDPSLILLPSTYDALLCGACVRREDLPGMAIIRRWAAAEGSGTRMIVWRTNAEGSESAGHWEVIGEEGDVNIVENDDNHAEHATTDALHGTKRPAEHEEESTEHPSKRNRIESPSEPLSLDPPALLSALSNGPIAATSCKSPSSNPVAQQAFLKPLNSIIPASSESDSTTQLGDGDSAGDIFLGHGWRERWCRCQDCLPALETTPYLLNEEEEAYEPPEDPDSSLTLEELGMRALERDVPRERALEGARAFGAMRDELVEYLRPFAAEGRVVQESDMRTFFEEKLRVAAKK